MNYNPIVTHEPDFPTYLFTPSQVLHLRWYSFWKTRQAADIVIIADTIVAAIKRRLIERDKILRPHDTLVDLDSIDADIKFSFAVMTCFFVFHDNSQKKALKAIELICLHDRCRLSF